MSYKGRYTPKNPQKYRGDTNDIIFRSLWERGTFKWCDTNDDILQWSSETIVIPYHCKTDGKMHRYFVDLWIKFKSGKEVLVEIKPKKQVEQPKAPPSKRITRRYLAECLQYTKNRSKWEAAASYAKDRGWEFNVWTEIQLAKLGITIIK